MAQDRLRLGFIPLVDCAPLVVARARGFFADEGLDVVLSREASWASIRDKVAYGVLDGAHMLAAMPLATTLGLGGPLAPMAVGLALNVNGSAVTVSEPLAEQLQAHGFDFDGTHSAAPLATIAAERRRQGLPPLTLAVVFPFSSHNYFLRYWLAAGGVDPDQDLRIVVVPPPQMLSYLTAGRVDGFCVSTPWPNLAVEMGIGRILITGYQIWNNAPDKVFGVTRAFAEARPAAHQGLIRALLRASLWLDRPENRQEAAALLAPPEIVNAPAATIERALLPMSDGVQLFFRNAAGMPWRSHALWFLQQMRRWGQIEGALDLAAIAAEVYRPEHYRAAAAALGLAVPFADAKPEGEHAGPHAVAADIGTLVLGPDRFCDGAAFDPTNIREEAPAGATRGIGRGIGR